MYLCYIVPEEAYSALHKDVKSDRMRILIVWVADVYEFI